MTEQIKRIIKMELYFDCLLKAAAINAHWIFSEVPLQEMLQELTHYYENGQWMQDFQADERGELPADLKRGILSEDGIYNFLEELDSLKSV